MNRYAVAVASVGIDFFSIMAMSNGFDTSENDPLRPPSDMP